MRIASNNSFFISNKSLSNRKNCSYLNFDGVSFGGKTNINYEMKKLPDDAFPSAGLQEFMLKNLRSNPDADVVEIHRAYYSDLFDCRTLEEAKEKYPEFKSVVDAKHLNLSGKPSNNVFCQIANGKIEGFNSDNVSLKMLQKYYAELIPVNDDYIKKNLNVSMTAFNTLIKTLNISMDKRYFRLLGLKMRASNMSKAWDDDEMRQRRAQNYNKTVSSPEYRQKRSELSKRQWENPVYRELVTSRISEERRKPETRTKIAEITRQLWQDKDYQKKMKINTIAATLAWKMHPYAKDVYKEIALEFPELKAALEGRRKGLPITDRQERIISMYYKTCAERYPDFKKEIGEIQKNLLQEWGYYDENRDIDSILCLAESIV